MLSRRELGVLGRSPTALRLLAIIAATRCSPFEALDRLIPDRGYEAARGLAYGPEPRQRLDLYRPQGISAPAPVLVYLYGGAWQQGSRAGYRFVGEAFAARGFVTAVPDYRLFPQVRFPAFVEDAAAAVRWLRANAAAHGGDPDRIFLVGHSAGAHIAALLALDRRYLAAAAVPEAALRGMVGLAGPYAVRLQDHGWVRPVFAGAADPEDARPLAFARADAPPMLLLHGGIDETVWPLNSDEMAARLQALGAPARQVTYPKLGHIGVVLALAAPFRGLAPVLDDAVAFLRAQDGPSP